MRCPPDVDEDRPPDIDSQGYGERLESDDDVLSLPGAAGLECVRRRAERRWRERYNGCSRGARGALDGLAPVAGATAERHL